MRLRRTAIEAARLGSLRDEREAERRAGAAMRIAQHLLGKISATAAIARATGAAREFAQAAHTLGGGLADHLLGDGIADADVHGREQWWCDGHIQLQMRMIVNYLLSETQPVGKCGT